jgi:hypothetical protein
VTSASANGETIRGAVPWGASCCATVRPGHATIALLLFSARQHFAF